MEDERNDLPMIAAEGIVQIAQEAEKRIDAIMKIKQMSLKVTNPHDWTNQQGRPYLQVSGAEKIANLFNISWRVDPPRMETEEDGNFTFTFRGIFSMGGRSIEVEGSRSSKDPFFKKYEWKDDGTGKKIKTEKPISAIDRRDVQMAALTNLFGNGITRLLGIRNLEWKDLKEYAGIKQEEVAGIDYKKNGEKQPIEEPKKKATIPSEEKKETLKVTTTIIDVSLKEGERQGKDGKTKWTLYRITGDNEQAYQTFDTKIGDLAIKERGSGMPFEIEYEEKEFQGKDGNKTKSKQIISMTAIEDEPGSQG